MLNDDPTTEPKSGYSVKDRCPQFDLRGLVDELEVAFKLPTVGDHDAFIKASRWSQDQFWCFFLAHPQYSAYIKWLNALERTGIEWTTMVRGCAHIFNHPEGSQERYNAAREAVVDGHKRLFYGFLCDLFQKDPYAEGAIDPNDDGAEGFDDEETLGIADSFNFLWGIKPAEKPVKPFVANCLDV